MTPSADQADTGKQLMAMYRAMRARFGHRHWWPGDTALEVCIGAILTQNTSWANVEKAMANLKAGGALSVSGLVAKPQAVLALLVRPAGYFNVKAKRLRCFLTHVHEGFGDDIEGFLRRPVAALRGELLSIHGIGPETADSILLYAAGKASFVIDAYTRRVLVRHGRIDRRASYDAIKALFESSLPRRVPLWNDYHAQLVEVGKRHCRPAARCEGCPLEGFAHTDESV